MKLLELLAGVVLAVALFFKSQFLLLLGENIMNNFIVDMLRSIVCHRIRAPNWKSWRAARGRPSKMAPSSIHALYLPV
jgi:hypothetical protein